MEADDRTPAVGAPLGAAAASGSTPLSKRGLSGPADEAAAAAYGGAEAAMMLWTLQHHPSSNANVKLGGAGGGNMYVRISPACEIDGTVAHVTTVERREC